MKELNIDIETYSSVDLKKCGVYRYAESDDFEILLFAYSVDGGEVQLVDLAQGEELPQDILDALTDPGVTKIAFNAQFERVCITHHLRSIGAFTGGEFLPPAEWQCTKILSLRLSHPASLAASAKALEVEEKDSAGVALINYFSKPCKPTKVNGGRTRNLPEHDPVKWQAYREYNIQDVATELAVRNKLLPWLTPCELEDKAWIIDQEINDRGVYVDTALVDGALEIDEKENERIDLEMKRLSGLANPGSTQQVRAWLAEAFDIHTDTVAAAWRKERLADPDTPQTLKDFLELQTLKALTSVKKYRTIKEFTCKDNSLKGLFQLNGASSTGRFAGRGPQPQNLTKHNPHDVRHALGVVRSIVAKQDLDTYQLLYSDTPLKNMLSQLLRTTMTARPGKSFKVADFSAIEARITPWFSGETWRNDVFATHGKIYEASASEMFNIPLEQITKDSPYRKKGKVAELALGYQGGPGALVSMGAAADAIKTFNKDKAPHFINEADVRLWLAQAMSAKRTALEKARLKELKTDTVYSEALTAIEQDLRTLVTQWREASPSIVKFWHSVEKAAKRAISSPGAKVSLLQGKLGFEVRHGHLYIRLPSGRELCYPNAYIKTEAKEAKRGGSFVVENIMFYSYKGIYWSPEYTYGGKLVENIVQATARDALVYTMLKIRERGGDIVLHIHDEVVVESDGTGMQLDDLLDVMAEPIPWAEGLNLVGDGFVSNYFLSD